ncbi:MAG: putative quinol monooxygenase [Flavobacteriaceae bacterium]
MKTIPKVTLLLMLAVLISIVFGFDSRDRTSDTSEGINLIVLVKYKTQPDKGSTAVSELFKLIEKVEQEPHFVNIKLHVDPDDNTNILLYEEWDDGAYYKSDHMNTPHLQDFIAESRSFLAGPPEISFWEVKREFNK